MANRGGALVLSLEAKAKMRGIVRNLGEERSMFVQRNELEAKRRKIEKGRLERRQRRYIRLARKGFTMLIAFARSATMRKFFRIATRSFIFFDHRDNASIHLFSDEMQIHFYGGAFEEFSFSYDSPESFYEWLRDTPQMFNEWVYHYETRDAHGLSSFFSEGRIRRNRRDTGILSPVDMILSVFVDCADSKKFKSYLIDALKENR